MVSEGVTLFAAVSRSVRTADASERYMANYMGMNGVLSWIGNPNLDPEKHHQADIGLTYQSTMMSISGSVYYNQVTDFIQLDSARGQRGVLVNNPQASVYTNIDAVLAGVEAEAELRLNDYWRVNLSAAYTYGENESDNIPLSQIAPLSGRFELTYDNSEWLAGFRVNAAAKQKRIDDDRTTGSGRDSAGPADDYVTLDLFAGYNVNENVQITGGVTNVFDEVYANHLNKRDLTDPVGIRVNEPGRSFYARLVTKY